MLRHALLLAVLVLGLSACNRRPAASSPAPPSAPAELRIAVVPKGTTHDFWKSVHAGALTAERELGGIRVTFRGPEREDDRAQQVALVENLISGRYHAIVLAPLDAQALVGPVRQAAAANIPVVIIDSDLAGSPGTDFVSFVATDNERAGELGGERLASALGGKGRVLLLRYMEGSASTTARERGFLKAMLRHEGITVIDRGRYAGATRATAQEVAENLLAAHAAIDGVFCPNESSTFGMLLALRSRGMAAKVRFVGFDASEPLIDALRAGEIDALVVQSPMRMGYLGVKAAVDHVRGSPVEARIDTGATVIDGTSVDSAEARELLAPDLSSLPGTR